MPTILLLAPPIFLEDAAPLQEVGFLVKLEEEIAKCKLLGHDQLHVQ